MKKSELQQIINEAIKEVLKEKELMTIDDLKLLKPNDHFIINNTISDNEGIVISNSSKQLTYNIDTPGVGVISSTLMYKDFNQRRNLYFYKRKGGPNMVFRYYKKPIK
jgi:hypothetical protein